MGAASPWPDPRAGPHGDVRGVRSPGRRHGHARGGPRPPWPRPVRLGVFLLPAGQPDRDRAGRARRGPSRPGASFCGGPGPLRRRAPGGRARSVHVGAGHRPLSPGTRCRRRARRGLRGHRPQPPRGSTGADDGGVVDGLGRPRHRRTRGGGRGEPSLRLALGLPRPHPARRRGGTPCAARVAPSGCARRRAKRGAPGRRRRTHRGRSSSGVGCARGARGSGSVRSWRWPASPWGSPRYGVSSRQAPCGHGPVCRPPCSAAGCSRSPSSVQTPM